MPDPDEQLSIDEELGDFGDWILSVCQSNCEFAIEPRDRVRRVSQAAAPVIWRNDLLVPRHNISPEDCQVPIVNRDPGDENEESE